MRNKKACVGVFLDTNVLLGINQMKILIDGAVYLFRVTADFLSCRENVETSKYNYELVISHFLSGWFAISILKGYVVGPIHI